MVNKRKMLLVIALTSVAGAAAVWASTTVTGLDQNKLTVVTGGLASSSSSSTQSLQPSNSEASSVTTASGDGCQSKSTRYPWGTASYRTWTPSDTSRAAGSPGSYDSSGTRTGAPFSARLIQAYGRDVGDSKQSVILEMTDGCRRRYRSSSFIASDVSFVNSEINNHPFPVDSYTYATSVAEEGLVTQAQVQSGAVSTYQTKHFNIMFGTKTGNFSYRYESGLNVPWNTFIASVGKTFEAAWQIDRNVLDAPMPYLNSPARKKINVYICGTGMPFIQNGDDASCGATGAAGIYVDAPSVQEGATTVVHEFGHVIQFYTGGFRDKPEAGPIWETGAEWTSFEQSQTVEYFLIYYLSNLENGPLWSNNRYASFPFMSFLFEQEKTRPFVWSGWTGNLRDANGASTEDWTQTFVRQAQAAGVYPSGYTSFADDMGWYGARLVAMDFLDQQALIDIKHQNLAANFYTSLRTKTSGSYTSPSERQLREWGSHIVPLTSSGSQVSATVKGATSAGSAAWRTMLVSVSANGTPRYSAMGKITGTGSATISLAAASNEKMYLVVTATPNAYESLGWQPANAAVTGAAFPYTVQMTGATALTTPASTCTSVIPGTTGSNFNYNTNGRVDGGVPCP